MSATLRIVFYAAGLAWAVATGLSPVVAAQLAALGGAIVLASEVFSRRGGAFGVQIGAWLELAFAAAVFWNRPGRPEFAWMCLPAASLAATESPQLGLRIGAAWGTMCASAAMPAFGGRLEPTLFASAVAFPLVGWSLGQNPVARPDVEEPEELPPDDLEFERQRTQQALDAERAARRSYRELVGLYRQLKAAYDDSDVSLRVTKAALARENVAERLVNAIVDITDASGATLWLADPDGKELTVRSCVGKHRLSTSRIPIDSAESLAARLARKGPEFAQQMLTGGSDHVEHLITAGSKVLGMLTLRPPGRGSTLRRVDSVLQALHEPLAHAQAQDALQRKLELAEARIWAADLILSDDGADAVAGRAIELLKRFVEAEHWSVWLLAPSGEAKVAAERGRPFDPIASFGLAGNAFGKWVSAEETMYASDAATDGILTAEQAVKLRVRSVLGAPLESGGKSVGAVFAVSSQPDAFSPTDRSIVLRLTGPLARSLEVARVRERPLAVVRLDPATGLLNYRAFAERLRDEADRRPAELGVVRLTAERGDPEQINALGRAIAGAFGEIGFASACGEREFIGCLVGADRTRAQAVADLIASRFSGLRVVARVANLGKDGWTRHELIDATSD